MSAKITSYNGFRIGSRIDLSADQVTQLVALFESPPGNSRSKLAGRAPIRNGSIDGIGRVAVKRYTRGGLINLINKHQYLRTGKPRCQKEYEMLVTVRRHGVTVPEPIAFAYCGRLAYSGWLITREVHEPLNLAQLCETDRDRCRTALGGLAEQIRILIEKQVLHVDLHPGNVLVDGENHIYIVDFDRARVTSWSRKRLREHYLSRWSGAVAKHKLPTLLQEELDASLLSPPTPGGRVETNILIVLTGSLGDIARALCLPAHLKTHFSGSRLSWTVEEKWRDLIDVHPHIDRTVPFKRAWRIRAAAHVLGQLKSESYDIALDLQRIFKSGLLSRASGARRRIGFHPRNAKELNWIFNNEHIGFLGENAAKLQHYLKFCRHLGLPDPEKLDFGLKSQIPAFSIKESPGAPYIGVVIGSTWPSKNWTLEGYQGLISKILAAGRHTVVLLGDQTQTTVGLRLKERLPPGSVIDLVGRTSIMELASILNGADAAVGPDTGSGHLAAAVGTPYVAMVGPTAAARVAPYGCGHLVVKADVPCSPCLKKKCRQPQYDCMGAISADAVFDKLSVALEQSGPSPQ